MEGHQRSIMGNMTVEEIYKDRLKFNSAVFKVASTALVAMGMTVISYTIKSLSDEMGYLDSLGMARTAQVRLQGRYKEVAKKLCSEDEVVKK